jgi:hypothetical protein
MQQAGIIWCRAVHAKIQVVQDHAENLRIASAGIFRGSHFAFFAWSFHGASPFIAKSFINLSSVVKNPGSPPEFKPSLNFHVPLYPYIAPKNSGMRLNFFN